MKKIKWTLTNESGDIIETNTSECKFRYQANGAVKQIFRPRPEVYGLYTIKVSTEEENAPGQEYTFLTNSKRMNYQIINGHTKKITRRQMTDIILDMAKGVEA